MNRIIEQHPDAVIMLFSDHGGRETSTEENGEWHHSFLVARTAGHAHLFGAAPEAGTLLATLERTYDR